MYIYTWWAGLPSNYKPHKRHVRAHRQQVCSPYVYIYILYLYIFPHMYVYIYINMVLAGAAVALVSLVLTSCISATVELISATVEHVANQSVPIIYIYWIEGNEQVYLFSSYISMYIYIAANEFVSLSLSSRISATFEHSANKSVSLKYI